MVLWEYLLVVIGGFGCYVYYLLIVLVVVGYDVVVLFWCLLGIDFSIYLFFDEVIEGVWVIVVVQDLYEFMFGNDMMVWILVMGYVMICVGLCLKKFGIDCLWCFDVVYVYDWLVVYLVIVFVQFYDVLMVFMIYVMEVG